MKTILNRKSQVKNKYPKLLIIAPPLARDDGSGKYEGALKKSEKFNEIYKKIAENNNCCFVDNNLLETGIDGVHLTEQSHKILSEKLY